MSEPVVNSEKTLSIVVDSDLPESPELVWRALTEPQLLEAWLMPNNIRAEVGVQFTFQTNPAPGWDGVVQCEVLEAVPFERLVYSWGGGSKQVDGYGHSLSTVVTWTLSRNEDGGTHLHLEHSGFPPESFAYKAMSQGWQRKLQSRISEVLSAGQSASGPTGSGAA
jgi:uncharacterized protein YndB with AHSA1/START domain